MNERRDSEMEELEAQEPALRQAWRNAQAPMPPAVRERILEAVHEASRPATPAPPRSRIWAWQPVFAVLALMAVIVGPILRHGDTVLHWLRGTDDAEDLRHRPLVTTSAVTGMTGASGAAMAGQLIDPVNPLGNVGVTGRLSFSEGTLAATLAMRRVPLDLRGCPRYLWVMPNLTDQVDRLGRAPSSEELAQRLPATLDVKLSVSGPDGESVTLRRATRVTPGVYVMPAQELCVADRNRSVRASFDTTPYGLVPADMSNGGGWAQLFEYRLKPLGEPLSGE